MRSCTKVRTLRNGRTVADGDPAQRVENCTISNPDEIADGNIPWDGYLSGWMNAHMPADSSPKRAEHEISPTPKNSGAKAKQRMAH
ncbi:hypothetical protein [Mesorhizobium sp.]|nr:hypothetical protein [Mesorhizobium sp.]